MAGWMEREAVWSLRRGPSPSPVTPDRRGHTGLSPGETSPFSPERSRPRPKHSSASSPLPAPQATGQPCPGLHLTGPRGRLLPSREDRPTACEGPKCGECPHCWHPSFSPHGQEGPQEDMPQGESNFLVPTGSPNLFSEHPLLFTACCPPPGSRRMVINIKGKKPVPKRPSPPLIQILHGWGSWDRSHRPPKRGKKEVSGKMLPTWQWPGSVTARGHLNLQEPLLLSSGA